MTRFIRAWLVVGILLYTAIAVTPVLRFLDIAIGAQASDAFIAFDASSFLDQERTSALWEQWLYLWLASVVYWWLLAPLLVVLGRFAGAAPVSSPLRALGRVFVPILATWGINAVIDDVFQAIEHQRGETGAELRRQQQRAGRRAAVIFMATPVAQFVLVLGVIIWSSGRGAPGISTQLAVLAFLFVPLGAGAVARTVQLYALRRAARDLFSKPPSRASHAEPVSG